MGPRAQQDEAEEEEEEEEEGGRIWKGVREGEEEQEGHEHERRRKERRRHRRARRERATSRVLLRLVMAKVLVGEHPSQNVATMAPKGNACGGSRFGLVRSAKQSAEEMWQ